MKMIYAGLAGSANVSADKHRYNCTRNPQCQRAWYIPVNDLLSLDLYFELPFMPATYTLTMVALNGVQTQLVSGLYIVGEHPKGYYGVFSNLVAAGSVPDCFYIKGEFSFNQTTAVFYSNDFRYNDCNSLTKVEGCYNNVDAGVNAYDINGLYYGYPVNGEYLGNNNWRYYHNASVRFAKVTNTKHKLSVSLFNSKRAFKSQTSKVYNFASEVVPEFYKDEIMAVISRGNITIGNKPYSVSDEVDLSVHTEDSGLWVMDIPLSVSINTYFSCKTTVCRALPDVCCNPTEMEISSDIDKCCNPMEVSISSEPAAECRRYEITGISEFAYFSWTDCETGQVMNDYNIGLAGIRQVCSTTFPVGYSADAGLIGPCDTPAANPCRKYKIVGSASVSYSWTDCNGIVQRGVFSTIIRQTNVCSLTLPKRVGTSGAGLFSVYDIGNC